MFVLTKEEKRVVCFVLLAIIVGLGVKEYRRVHSSPNAVPISLKQRPTGVPARQIRSVEEPTTSSPPDDSQLKKRRCRQVTINSAMLAGKIPSLAWKLLPIRYARADCRRPKKRWSFPGRSSCALSSRGRRCRWLGLGSDSGLRPPQTRCCSDGLCYGEIERRNGLPEHPRQGSKCPDHPRFRHAKGGRVG